MITMNETYGTGCCQYEMQGLSTDPKPTHVSNGSTFHEIDTAVTYMYDAQNMAWYPQVASSGGGGGVSSYNDLSDKPVMVIDLTYLDDGETGMYTVALSKSFDEINAAYAAGVALFVRDGVLFQAAKLQGEFLTCYGLTSNSYGEQFRLISFSLRYDQDNQWSMLPVENMLYDPKISGLVLYSGGRQWRIEVNSSGQVVATDFYA
jgi:hypothetical protein